MSAKLSKDEIEAYKRTFKKFDKDGNGKISSTELRDVIKMIGLHVTDDDVDKMMKVADADGSGTVEFKEFITMVTESLARNKDDPGLSPAEMRRTLKKFDKNGDGKISREELKTAVNEMGLRYTDAQLDQMMKEADTNKDGSVDYEEFINILTVC